MRKRKKLTANGFLTVHEHYFFSLTKEVAPSQPRPC